MRIDAIATGGNPYRCLNAVRIEVFSAILRLFLYKITDCVRMDLSSVRNQRSTRTVCRPRNIDRRSSIAALRAARQPRFVQG